MGLLLTGGADSYWDTALRGASAVLPAAAVYLLCAMQGCFSQNIKYRDFLFIVISLTIALAFVFLGAAGALLRLRQEREKTEGPGAGE